MRTVLLVDDDETFARLLKELLRSHGFNMIWADRPSSGRALLASGPDLLLLDVMLPEQSGLEFCQALRAEGHDLPIVMLTARGTDVDRVTGLNLGADDYMAKPFNHLELIARMEAILRRRTVGRLVVHDPMVSDGLDADRRILCLRGREINLTPMEFRLMELFTRHPGRTWSRRELIAWCDEVGISDSLDRAIDSHISRLRNKLERDSKNPEHLFTIRGAGYRFVW